jgi:transcription initiation factor TFIIIB Brf1 subunit/transcription initiation factor TFIIB
MSEKLSLKDQMELMNIIDNDSLNNHYPLEKNSNMETTSRANMKTKINIDENLKIYDVRKQSAAKDADDDVEESAAKDADESDAKDADESDAKDADESVDDVEESAIDDVDESAVNDVEESAIDDVDESAVNDVEESVAINKVKSDTNVVKQKTALDAKIKQIEKCSACNKSNTLILNNSRNYLICNECGVVMSEFLNEFPDFISNENEYSENSRYGNPNNHFYPISSLRTNINSKGRHIKITRTQNQGKTPYDEKTLMEICEEFNKISKKNGISNKAAERAKIFYKNISTAKHSKGPRIGKSIIIRCDNRKSIFAACLYYACKIQNEIRSPKEIADMYNLDIKHVNKGCKNFNDIIDVDFTMNKINGSQAVDFIDRVAPKINLDDKNKDKVKDIINNIFKLGIISNHEPPSIAAACILLLVNKNKLDINKKDVAAFFSISDVTISKCLNKVTSYKEILFDNNIVNTIIERNEGYFERNI